MAQRIAVETSTLNEISDLFQNSLEIAHPKFKVRTVHDLKKIKKTKIDDKQ